MKIAPLAEVKDRLSAYIDAAKESAIVVTRNGKPVALLTPILEDDDLDKIAGKREQLEGKIQERAGITKDAARKSVDDWLNKQ